MTPQRTQSTPAWVPIAAVPDAYDSRHLDSVLGMLVATDPLGLLDEGHPGVDYASTAGAVLQVLATGGGVDELFRLFLTAGNRVEAVDTFTRSAVRWWDERVAA